MQTIGLQFPSDSYKTNMAATINRKAVFLELMQAGRHIQCLDRQILLPPVVGNLASNTATMQIEDDDGVEPSLRRSDIGDVAAHFWQGASATKSSSSKYVIAQMLRITDLIPQPIGVSFVIASCASQDLLHAMPTIPLNLKCSRGQLVALQSSHLRQSTPQAQMTARLATLLIEFPRALTASEYLLNRLRPSGSAKNV